MNALADRIKEIRKELGLNQPELGRLAGVSKGAINQWETGKTQAIKAEYLLKLSRATGYNSEWISSGKGPKKPEGQQHNIAEPTVFYGGKILLDTDTAGMTPESAKLLETLINNIKAGKISDDDLRAALRLLVKN